MKYVSKMLIIIGSLMIVASLLIVAFNMHLQSEGEKTRKAVLKELKEKMEDESLIKPVESVVSDEERNSNDVIIIDGVAYIGYITIPSLDIELPISKDWDGELLNMGACRYDGSTYQNDLVICAHNYYTYFAKIYKLSAGDEVIFTDIYNNNVDYIVSYQEVIDGKDIDAILKEDDAWDLTLFTCTLSGMTRQTVRCVRKQD